MIRYTEEKKAAALKRMMAPESCSVAKLSVELGSVSLACIIGESTRNNKVF